MVTEVQLKVEMEELVEEYQRSIWRIIGSGVTVSMILAVLFLLTGLSMTVLEREAEYATLRSFGFTPLEIVKMVGVEVIGLATFATLLSLPFAYLLTRYLAHQIAVAWFPIPFHYLPIDFVRIIGPTLAFLPLAALPPLYRLLSSSPARVLRARAYE